MYAKTHQNAQVLNYIVNVTNVEFFALKFTDLIETVVVAIYRPPNPRKIDFLLNLRNLLDVIEIMDQGHVLICGYFNEDIMSHYTKPIAKFIHRKMMHKVNSCSNARENQHWISSLHLSYKSAYHQESCIHIIVTIVLSMPL